MSTVDRAYPLALPQPRPLARGHVLIGLVATFPLWWLAGLFAFVWPIVAFFLLLALTRQGDVLFPRAFSLWLLLLAWAPLSLVAVSEADSGLLFVHRLALLAAAGLVFLYIFNSSRETLPDRAIIDALTLFWAMLIVGSFVSMAFPTLSFHSPVELVLPAGFVANQFVHDLVHVDFAQVQSFLGYPVGRPSPFFTFTNAWGSGVALLTPIAVAGIAQSRSAVQRRLLLALLVLSFIPIVVSLNRGVWLALTLALAYTALRFALAIRLNALAALIGFVGFLLILLFLTPLGGLLSDRLATPHSNQGREALYREALERTQESPLIGYGGPVPPEDGTGPPVGTHSQLFFLSVSYGLPVVLLFVAWFALTFLRAGRAVSGPLFAAHVALLIFLMEAPYYLLQMHIVVAMIIAAFVWRAVVHGPAPARDRVPRSATA
jgi:polysaccharide biosynthesis protein PslJ